MARPRLIEVEWMDACTIFGGEKKTLRELAKEDGLTRRLSCGYLVVKDREKIKLAHTIDPPDDDRGEYESPDVTTIPRGWVMRVIDQAPAETQEAE